MDIDTVSRLPRRGNLLQIDDETLKSLLHLARSVKRTGEISWSAATPYEAAAWLTLQGHYNCCLDRTSIPEEWLPFPSNLLLTFRGQRAEFTTLKPTLWRMSDEEQISATRSVNWFHVIVNIWLKSSFRWSKPPHAWLGLDRRDTCAIAQHYSDSENGLGTDLIDWTFSPLVALAFAIESTARNSMGSLATVLMRPVKKDEKDQVILPPTVARRTWRQSGLFQRFWARRSHERQEFCDQFGIRSIIEPRPRVESYPRITFPVDEPSGTWAVQRYTELMNDDSPFPVLAIWSRSVAEQIRGCKRRREIVALGGRKVQRPA